MRPGRRPYGAGNRDLSLSRRLAGKPPDCRIPLQKSALPGVGEVNGHFRTAGSGGGRRHNHARGAIAAKACASSIGKGNTIVEPRSLAMSNNVPR